LEAVWSRPVWRRRAAAPGAWAQNHRWRRERFHVRPHHAHYRADTPGAGFDDDVHADRVRLQRYPHASSRLPARHPLAPVPQRPIRQAPQCAPAAGDSPGARPHRPGPPHRGRRGRCRREPERPSLRQGPSRASRLVAGADSSRSVEVRDGAPGRCRTGPHLDLGSGPRLHPGDGYARAIVG